jgi:hypothetical protein
MDLELDYKELISSLRNKTDLSAVSVCNATVVFNNAEKDLNVWQLSPLAGTLLHLCDGQRTVADIVREFSSLETSLPEIPADKVCLFGLTQLFDDGFIALSSASVIREDRLPLPRISVPAKSNTQQPWPRINTD